MLGGNVTLIGMPGVGKSTVGVVLAKMMCRSFVDGDLLIQAREHRSLSKIIAERGNEGFLKIENATLAELKIYNAVIATGGSAVFGREAMANLKKISTVVYLRMPIEELEKRLGSLRRRGVVMEEGQTLRDIFEIRAPLYEKYADIVVDVTGDGNIQSTADRIIDLLDGRIK